MAENWLMRVSSCGIAVILAGWSINWLMSPSEAELVAEGRELFLHEWTEGDPLSADGDGLGPVFNEKSCVACHFQGGVGGGGSSEKNVTAFQALPNRKNPNLQSGVIHAAATELHYQESRETLRKLHPAIPETTRIVDGCTYITPGFDPLLIQQINTPALFGVGLIDEISAFAIKSGRQRREFGRVAAEFSLDFKNTRPGRVRDHGMGSVGRFGWQGQFSTLREFVATACAVELGLSNPERSQDVPREHRPDESAEYDMSSAQLDSLVAYCRSLPRPEQVLPKDAQLLAKVRNGEALFQSVGCSDCHTPSIGGVDGIYSDFLLYKLQTDQNESGYQEVRDRLEVPLPDHLPTPEEWQTPPLWGVADSAPYFHDGQSATLEQAIGRHRGAAKHVMQRHKRLSDDEKRNIVQFLKTLKAPATADQLKINVSIPSGGPST